MQKLAFEANLVATGGAPVLAIAADRMADRLEVDADLVGAAGLELHAQERGLGKLPLDLEVRDRGARLVGGRRVQRAVAPVAADGRVDRPGARVGPADDERQVLAPHAALAHRLLERAVDGVRLRDDEQPRSVLVQPVDDARPELVLAAGRAARQRLRERAGVVARRRVDDNAGRLVDDEQVVVLVDDLELDLVGAGRVGRRLWDRRDLDRLARLQDVALLPRLATDGDGAGVDQLLGGRARADALVLAERGVQALTRSGGYGEGFDLASPSMT